MKKKTKSGTLTWHDLLTISLSRLSRPCLTRRSGSPPSWRRPCCWCRWWRGASTGWTSTPRWPTAPATSSGASRRSGPGQSSGRSAGGGAGGLNFVFSNLKGKISRLLSNYWFFTRLNYQNQTLIIGSLPRVDFVWLFVCSAHFTVEDIFAFPDELAGFAT